MTSIRFMALLLSLVLATLSYAAPLLSQGCASRTDTPRATGRAKRLLRANAERPEPGLVGLALAALRFEPLALDDDDRVMLVPRESNIDFSCVCLPGDVDDAGLGCSPLRRVNRSSVRVNDPGWHDIFFPGRARELAPISFGSRPITQPGSYNAPKIEMVSNLVMP